MNNGIFKALREARRRRGESQAELAARLGTSQQTVSRWEKGDGSIDEIVGLCRALGVGARFEVGDARFVLVHEMDPEERKEIEANIDWFQRLSPDRRLEVIADHVRELRELQTAAHSHFGKVQRSKQRRKNQRHGG